MTHFQNYDTDALIRKATVRTSLFGKKKCQIDKSTQGEMRVGEKNIDKASTQDTKGLDENRDGERTEDDAQVDYSAGMKDNVSAEDMARMAEDLENSGKAETSEAPTAEDTNTQATDIEAGRADVQARAAVLDEMTAKNTEIVESGTEEIDAMNEEIAAFSAELDEINATVAEETSANAGTDENFDGTGSGTASAYSLTTGAGAQEAANKGESSSPAKANSKGNNSSGSFDQVAEKYTSRTSEITSKIDELSA